MADNVQEVVSWLKGGSFNITLSKDGTKVGFDDGTRPPHPSDTYPVKDFAQAITQLEPGLQKRFIAVERLEIVKALVENGGLPKDSAVMTALKAQLAKETKADNMAQNIKKSIAADTFGGITYDKAKGMAIITLDNKPVTVSPEELAQALAKVYVQKNDAMDKIMTKSDIAALEAIKPYTRQENIYDLKKDDSWLTKMIDKELDKRKPKTPEDHAKNMPKLTGDEKVSFSDPQNPSVPSGGGKRSIV